MFVCAAVALLQPKFAEQTVSAGLDCDEPQFAAAAGWNPRHSGRQRDGHAVPHTTVRLVDGFGGFEGWVFDMVDLILDLQR